MSPPLAFEMTTELTVIAVTNLTILLGGIGKHWWDMRAAKALREDKEREMAMLLHTREQDRLDREQDRLDRAQLAQLTLAQLADVKIAGNDRLQALVSEVRKVKEVAVHGIRVNKEQIRVSNGHNEKIASVVTAMETLRENPLDVRVVNTERQVEVVNSEDNPVPIADGRNHPRE